MTTLTVAYLLARGEKPEDAVKRNKARSEVSGRRVIRHHDGYELTPSPDGKRWGGRVEWQADFE